MNVATAAIRDWRYGLIFFLVHPVPTLIAAPWFPVLFLERHTAHRDLRGASASALEDELAGCAERIARETGRRPSSFAYPYGFVDVAAAAEAARFYSRACTAALRTLGPGEDAYRLRRLDAYYFRAAGRLERWGQPDFRRYPRVREAARAVRAALAPGD